VADFFADWRLAAQAANAAERAVFDDYRRFLQGLGQPPSNAAIAEAKRKRELADQLLASAMRQIEAERNH
jgi:hypothetical protein